ncbi:GNAT family N-acetyltransferase [Pseudomonas sp. 30_B]|uniref:GNAT family N-acetyltransferase n=1 Tax=Pseudomonas sp. 30_B TaxID=2813575 RepID=UPI001A9DEECD|nr:GNAT family N-acetyltransferase [Pseudomonas sp. 30_B]
MSDLLLRPLVWAQDGEWLHGFDGSYSSDSILRIESAADGFILREERLPEAQIKRYPFADLEDDVAASDWTAVAIDEAGERLGFAIAHYEIWNRRAVLDDLFVLADARGRGVGKLLMDACLDWARGTEARHLWLETQNLNLPAVGFYRSRGFALSGLSTDLYDPAQVLPGEMALFFSYSLV